MITGDIQSQTDLVNKFNSISLDINRKVDKVNGKQLSTNDYTNEDKTLLTDISTSINSKLETKNIKAGSNVLLDISGNDITISTLSQPISGSYEYTEIENLKKLTAAQQIEINELKILVNELKNSIK